ncbi:MAG: tetratricopeptide repeat protein [Deltaproteobacteria bacterium]|nr:tetratricopeptide repeat protein [Deltaproteobacteria bacterium]
MIDMDRKDLALMMECGYILVGMQRFTEARQVFEGIAVLAPESEIPVVALGSVAFCEGHFKEAIKRYRRALTINAESPFAQAYLGEALFFLGETGAAVRALKAVAGRDAKGKAGAFAASLLEAIEQGFTPGMLSGVEDFKAYQREKGESHAS